MIMKTFKQTMFLSKMARVQKDKDDDEKEHDKYQSWEAATSSVSK